MENKQTKFTLGDRLIDFAVRIVNTAEKMPTTVTGKHLASQIIRSGSSPALNHGEAQASESVADFVHKMRICLKELRETMANLKIIRELNYFNDGQLDGLIQENNELIAIFVTSIKTAQASKK